MLDFRSFLLERRVSSSAFAINRLFAKFDPKATKKDQRGGTFTPEDIETIKVTKLGTVTPEVAKWARLGMKSKIPLFRYIRFNLTEYRKNSRTRMASVLG